MSDQLPVLNGRVLSTLNSDGSRRWLRPKLFDGKWLRRRRPAAFGLIALFVLLPWVRVAGRPALQLDVIARRFEFFGWTLQSTDTRLFMLAVLGVLLGVFLVTALVGRAWCGWACPQTVYLEHVFRPIERWLEGSAGGKATGWRKAIKYAIFAGLSVLLANVFLAWFVGTDRLMAWVLLSPSAHPAGFAIVAVTALLIFIDFAWFREQMCVAACPYARLQSALLDRHSLVVAYDVKRGEPRGRFHKGEIREAGDCIDCGACVVTCPVGIDIREGLQMECVGCTQCIDACDSVMAKVDLPPGLIRYTSEAALAGERLRLLRPRTVAYPLALLVVGIALVSAIADRGEAEVTVLRGLGTPFAVAPDGSVSNSLRVRILNHGDDPALFRVDLEGPAGLKVVAPQNPTQIEGGGTATVPIFAVLPAGAMAQGDVKATLRVTSDHYKFATPVRLLGPGTPRGP